MATRIAPATMFTTPQEILAPANASVTAQEPGSVEARIAEAQATSASARLLQDRGRIWFWSVLAVAAASQLYFFRELAAALALFAVAFAAIAFAVAGLYMLVKFGELAVARVASLRQPILQISRATGDTRKPA